jgi:uncharacterized protein
MRTERDQGDETALLPRLLVRLVNGVCRYPWLALTAALVLCGLSVYVSWTRLEFRTQRSDLISPHKDFQKRWLAYLNEFGDDNDTVVVVQGRDRAQMVEALEALAEETKRQPGLFDRLFYKVDLRPLHNRALLFLPSAEIACIQANLANMGLLLNPPPVFDPHIGWQNLSLAQLLAEAQRRLAAGRPGQPLPPEDEPFYTQLASIAKTGAAYLKNPASYANPWQSILQQPAEQKDLMAEPQYFFSGDGRLAFLLVRPVKDEASFTAAKASVDALHGVVGRMRARFPKLQFGLTGMPVLENDEMVASQTDSNTASWLALAGVALLYLVVFRSFRYPLLTVGTLLVGTAWAMGWLTVTVGHLNILSATFAVMLIGMGDYGVLWVTRYDQERCGGADVITAMRATVVSVGPGILTAAVTAALAFYAAMLADFQAIAELGWIAGSGVLLCALACFLVLPALLRLTDRRKAPRALPAGVLPLDPGGSRRVWLPALAGRPRWVIGVSLAATVVLGAFALRVGYDHNLLHLQSPDLESVRWELKLIEHTAGASWHALSYTATPEEALALKARYEKLPGVERVATVAPLVPRGQEKKLPRLRDIRQRLQKLPARGALVPHSPPNVARLKESLGEVLLGLQGRESTPCRARLVVSLMDLLNGLNRETGGPAERRLQRFEELMARDLADDLHRLRDVSTPEPIAVADLPECLRERFVGRTGKWLLRVYGKDSLWDYRPLERFVKQIRTVDPEATGLPFGTLEGLKAMKNGFQWAGVYAFGAIFLVLLLDFRTLKHVLIALAPLAMGMIAALGVMGLCGLPLNPANMIAFPLILGVGADNGVHVLHDFLSRRRGQVYMLNHSTGQGIMVAALTTILGFGTLMISCHRGLAGMGLLLTLGVTCCMLTALVFLPAVLRVLSTRGRAGKASEAAVVPVSRARVAA